MDVTETDLVAQRKKRKNERRRKRKREQGTRPRESYLAKSLSKLKPWECDGIARATWYRRQASETSRGQTIVLKEEPNLSHRGLQVEPVVGLSQTTNAQRRVITPGPPDVGPNLSHGGLKREGQKKSDHQLKAKRKEPTECL